MDDQTNTTPHLTGDRPAAADASMMTDRRELALIAIERTRMPMVVTDPRQRGAPIVLANHAFLELTGYTADEVLGRNCRFLQGPGTSATALAALRRDLENGGDVQAELVNYRKDGSSFVNQLAISPVIGTDGELLYYFGSQKDVTESRRLEILEETERRLLMEVDHRAMNAMAIVQSIVRMSRGDTLDSYATSIQGRVDALARAHRLLASRGWSGACLEELVGAEVEAHVRRVATDGRTVPLAPRVVQPLALVLHELMTNAIAHGALADSAGTIAIKWWSDADRATLQWREIASRKVQPPARPGFGIGTIEAVIKRQLGGSVAWDWSEGGLNAELTFATETSDADTATA